MILALADCLLVAAPDCGAPLKRLGPVDKVPYPKTDRSDVDEAAIACACFIIACRQAPGVFHLVEAALDAISKGIDVTVDGVLDFAVPLGGNDRHAAPAVHILPDEISIIAFIGNKNFRFRSIPHDRTIALKIGDLAARDGSGYRQSGRVDAEMNFCRKATF